MHREMSAAGEVIGVHRARSSGAAVHCRRSRGRHHGARPVDQLHRGGCAQQPTSQRAHHKGALGNGGRCGALLEGAHAYGRMHRVLGWDHGACGTGVKGAARRKAAQSIRVSRHILSQHHTIHSARPALPLDPPGAKVKRTAPRRPQPDTSAAKAFGLRTSTKPCGPASRPPSISWKLPGCASAAEGGQGRTRAGLINDERRQATRRHWHMGVSSSRSIEAAVRTPLRHYPPTQPQPHSPGMSGICPRGPYNSNSCCRLMGSCSLTSCW